MMTTAMENRLTVPARSPEAVEPAMAAPAAMDAGLLLTLTTRVHCRQPMQRVNGAEHPIRQPVYVDGSPVVALRPVPAEDSVSTYRCSCGFTIDDPGASMAAGGHALAS